MKSYRNTKTINKTREGRYFSVRLGGIRVPVTMSLPIPLLRHYSRFILGLSSTNMARGFFGVVHIFTQQTTSVRSECWTLGTNESRKIDNIKVEMRDATGPIRI